MPNCFLIMPFRPELNYLYRIIKQHVLVPLSQDDFVASSRALRETGQHLATAKGRTRTELLVRRLLGVDADIKILVALKDWLEAKYPP